MAQLTMNKVKDLVASKLPGDNIFSNAIDRNSDKSIGVFSAPESRMGNVETFGGDDLAPVKVYPVNILVRWTEDSDECETKSNAIYSTIKNIGTNFYTKLNDPEAVKIAFIRMLDSHPVSLGRDKNNVCEFSIRIDIFYYNEI